MSASDLAGALFLGALLALLTKALLAMRPRRPYLLLALAVLASDASLRVAAERSAERGIALPVLEHARNPARVDADDLGWPNRVAVFLFTALALWLGLRPAPGSRLVGVSLALVVPGALLNAVEPLARGFTTDYLPLGDWLANLGDVALVLGLPALLLGASSAEWKRAALTRN